MHLKNYSLITVNNKTTLSPHYDLLNTTIAQKNVQEELALPLKGKKKNLTAKDLLEYFPQEILNLNEQVIQTTVSQIERAFPIWEELIERSFLTLPLKEQYYALIKQRRSKLKF